MPSSGESTGPTQDEPSVGPPDVRAAGNETTFRTINEAIEEGRVTADGPVSFLCECGRLGCGVVIELSLGEYEAVRGGARRFLVAPGHQDPSDTLVAHHGGYVVIAKQGDAAVHAERTNPRVEGPPVQLMWNRGQRVSFVSVDIDAMPENVALARRWLIAFAAEHGADSEVQDRVALASDEAVTNAVLHAYPPSRPGKVHIEADVEDGDLEIVVADDGRGLRPGSSPRLGVGLTLVAQYSDRFAVRERLPRGIEVWMRFAITP